MRDDEYPARIADVVASTWAVSASGGFEPLPPGLRGWLGRALQLDARTAFPSAIEAQAELDRILGGGESAVSSESLRAFLARYGGVEQGAPSARPATRSPLRLHPVARVAAHSVTLPPVTTAPAAPVMPSAVPAAPAISMTPPRGTPVPEVSWTLPRGAVNLPREPVVLEVSMTPPHDTTVPAAPAGPPRGAAAPAVALTPP